MVKLPGFGEDDFPFEFDFSSSENFYKLLLKQVFQTSRGRRGFRQLRMDDERQCEIITLHARGKTLDEIGRGFGVTRERIRQIERKVWSQIAFCQHQLKPLEAVLVSILRKSGGFDKIENVAKEFRAQFGWQEHEIRYLLNHYLGGLSDRFVYVGDENTHVSLADHFCWKCDFYKGIVREVMTQIENQNDSLTLDEFAKEVRKRTDLLPDCRKCKSKAGDGSPELFLWIFKNDPDLSDAQERMSVRRASQFLGLNRSVLLVLKIAKCPLTKDQILEQLKKMFPKRNFTVKQIQSTTSNSPQCCDKIFLWDRGGIHSETLYIHKDYIKTDLPILVTIENLLIEKAEEGVVPQVRLNRLFNKYADECREAGIPNVYALFSSLKVRACPQFSFQRSPYIGFKGNRQKISNAKILENFVKNSDHPITRQEMREYGRTLGLQDEHISNTIVLTTLIATQRGYIYREDFPETTPEFQQIVQALKKKLEQNGSVPVLEFYRSEKKVCETLGIVDSKMLYSLLRRYGDRDISLKYPFVCAANLQ